MPKYIVTVIERVSYIATVEARDSEEAKKIAEAHHFANSDSFTQDDVLPSEFHANIAEGKTYTAPALPPVCEACENEGEDGSQEVCHATDNPVHGITTPCDCHLAIRA